MSHTEASRDHMGPMELTQECCQASSGSLKPTGSGMMSLGKLTSSRASRHPWRHNGLKAPGGTGQQKGTVDFS